MGGVIFEFSTTIFLYVLASLLHINVLIKLGRLVEYRYPYDLSMDPFNQPDLMYVKVDIDSMYNDVDEHEFEHKKIEGSVH